MISFIDEHRGVFGVEPICRLLPIAPSTYYENVAKRLGVDRLSIRARSDVSLKIEIRRVFEQNFRVYGVRKVWRQLKREGFDVARCTVARLVRLMSLQGVIRGKPVRATFSDKTDPHSQKLLKVSIRPEVIHRRGPWRNFEAVEFATLEWVDWFNHRRLLEPIGNIPPAEAEERYSP
jgi:transposase InsO family protein